MDMEERQGAEGFTGIPYLIDPEGPTMMQPRQPRFSEHAIRLMQAVLGDVIFLLKQAKKDTIPIACGNWRGRCQAIAEAMEWLNSDDDSHPFAFVRICQAFDLEPEQARAAIWEQYGERGLA